MQGRALRHAVPYQPKPLKAAHQAGSNTDPFPRPFPTGLSLNLSQSLRELDVCDGVRLYTHPRLYTCVQSYDFDPLVGAAEGSRCVTGQCVTHVDILATCYCMRTLHTRLSVAMASVLQQLIARSLISCCHNLLVHGHTCVLQPRLLWPTTG